MLVSIKLLTIFAALKKKYQLQWQKEEIEYR